MALSKADYTTLEELSEKHPIIKKALIEIESFKEDSIRVLYLALNNQLLKIAQTLEKGTIDIAGDDKVFDRFLKLTVEAGTIAKNIDDIKAIIFPQEGSRVAETDKKGGKRNFLDKKADQLKNGTEA